MKAVVATFNQEEALVGAFSVITNLRMELFQAPAAIDLDDGVGVNKKYGQICNVEAESLLCVVW